MRVALLASVLASLVLGACASGSNAGPPMVDAEVAKDATAIDSTSIDPKPIDAFVPQDAPAALPDAPPPDAPPTGGACSRNDQCPHPDECCINLGTPLGFCGPGTEFGDECIPDL